MKTKPKRIPPTRFADFIRNASSREKKRVYRRVIERASERQRRLLEAARFLECSKSEGNPPFLNDAGSGTQAVMAVLIRGVIPPRAMFDLSLLYVQSHSVAKSRTSAMLTKMNGASQSDRTVLL